MIRWSALLALAACTTTATTDEVTPSEYPLSDELVDTNPADDVFEAELTATQATITLASGEQIETWGYSGRVPGPVIRVGVGERTIVHYTSELPEDLDSTVHWHGIEGNNASDGTPVTQVPTGQGQSFTYDFVPTRAGTYWYHPHHNGAQLVFDGLYGALVVEDPDEPALRELGILPEHELLWLLSDITAHQGEPQWLEDADHMEVMSGTEGKALLVNGEERPVFEVPAGDPLRIRVVNTSIARYWGLHVDGHTLYRVGGEGGLLDQVRVEGGTVPGEIRSMADGSVVGQTQVDLGYPRGDVLLAPGERADLVLVPQGEPGDQLVVSWEDYARGRYMGMGGAEDDGQRPGVEIAVLHLVEGEGLGWDLDEGDPILGAVGRSTEPVDLSGPVVERRGKDAMILSERMDHSGGGMGMEMEFLLDGESWVHDGHHAMGPDMPEAPTAVHARLGQTLVWEVRNESMMDHPIHLHGFSYQPISFWRLDEQAGTVISWEVDHVELEDTTNIPGGTTMLMHVRLDDPVGDGGAVGRWMRHCHILQHGEGGMMSELIVSE